MGKNEDKSSFLKQKGLYLSHDIHGLPSAIAIWGDDKSGFFSRGQPLTTVLSNYGQFLFATAFFRILYHHFDDALIYFPDHYVKFFARQ